MQRAAAGLAAVCARELRDRRGRVVGAQAVLLVGAGNNGGDALWAGSRLARRGVRVDAVLLGPAAHEEGLAALRAAGGRRSVPADRGLALLRAADLVVDGIVGPRRLAGPARAGRRAGRRAGAAGDVRAALVVAVDLPSGVDPDTGETPAPHVRADVTVTFGAAKPCLLLPPADRAAGRVRGRRHRSAARARGPRPTGRGAAHRRRRGRALAGPRPRGRQVPPRRRRASSPGSAAYTGAAVLAVGGALRAGAGMVRYVGPGAPRRPRPRAWPEAVDGRGPGAGVGAGFGRGPGRRRRAGRPHPSGPGRPGSPCAVDAGRSGAAGRGRRAAPGAALAPRAHAARRRAGPSADRRPERRGSRCARSRGPAGGRGGPAAGRGPRARAATGATVLLKGSTTLVVARGGRPGAHRPTGSALAGHGRGRRRPGRPARHAARRRARPAGRRGARGRRARPGRRARHPGAAAPPPVCGRVAALPAAPSSPSTSRQPSRTPSVRCSTGTSRRGPARRAPTD